MRLEYTSSFQGPPSVFQFFTFRLEGNKGKFSCVCVCVLHMVVG